MGDWSQVHKKEISQPVRGLAVFSIRNNKPKVGDKTVTRKIWSAKTKRNFQPVRGLAVLCIRTIIGKLGTGETDETVTRFSSGAKMDGWSQAQKIEISQPVRGLAVFSIRNNKPKVGDRRNGRDRYTLFGWASIEVLIPQWVVGHRFKK